MTLDQLLCDTGLTENFSDSVFSAVSNIFCVFMTPEAFLFSFEVDMISLTDRFALLYLYI